MRRVPKEIAENINARHIRSHLRVATGSTGTWVAEIIGLDHTTGRIKRKFLDGLKDYSNANSVGSRGVHKYYVLTGGPLYEIVDRPGYGKPQRRRYCRVEEGRIVVLEIGEVLRCLS
jgi:hypothetical protein